MKVTRNFLKRQGPIPMIRKSSDPKSTASKQELFASTPVPKALMTMAVPTIISQLINLIYNMVDAFFIGRTGNSYMMAATSLTLTLVMMIAAPAFTAPSASAPSIPCWSVFFWIRCCAFWALPTQPSAMPAAMR